MDELVQRAIKEADSKAKTDVPWEFDKPWEQQFHAYSKDQQKWQPSDKSAPNTATTNFSRLALYSWNIDFMLPHPDSRMTAAIRHLESTQIGAQDKRTASVIFLQECLTSDLIVLASNPWIQQNFALTDLDTSNWQSGYYGTVTLVDLRLNIESCFRVHFSQTRMQRDGLFVDVRFGSDNKLLRLCNTHLESLALDPPYRPPQMKLIAQYMHDSSISGAAVAGDFNAIQDMDDDLHSNNYLKDAYLELKPVEEEVKWGHTWGQQAAISLRKKFGTSRMDKVFFCGSLKCPQFERFGADIEVEDGSERKDITDLGFEQPWITDHLGVMAIFEPLEAVNGAKSTL